MRTMSLLRPCLVVLFLVAGLLPLAASPPSLMIEEVTVGVYAFRPTEDAFRTWRAASNSAAVVLEDGVLIYDSHWTPDHVAEATALLRKHTDKPIRYVVQSHYHGDHTGGAWAYGPEVEIISHHATRERLEAYFAELPETLPTQIEGLEKATEGMPAGDRRSRFENMLRYDRALQARIEAGGEPPLPSLTFESKIVLHRGLRVEVYFFGRGHTDGDAVVFLPEKGIALVGDLVFNGMIPNLADGHSEEWIATLRQIAALGPKQVVPGHGALATGAVVERQIAYLEWLRSAVGEQVRGGKTLEEAQAAVELPAAYEDFGMRQFFGGNVAKVYQELASP
ncbi:MAG: MBL fold metallo-hydrolase [Acidobacteriota bacterium]